MEGEEGRSWEHEGQLDTECTTGDKTKNNPPISLRWYQTEYMGHICVVHFRGLVDHWVKKCALHHGWLLINHRITSHSSLSRDLGVSAWEKKKSSSRTEKKKKRSASEVITSALLSADATQTFGKIWVCSWHGRTRQLTWNDKLERETMFACCQRSCKRGNVISRWRSTQSNTSKKKKNKGSASHGLSVAVARQSRAAVLILKIS